MRILCVIPVRGGSKGIPGKNRRIVAGKPLVAWTIEQALQARPVMDVLVSTDDEELAAIARDAGAQVPWLRPAHLAEDTTATEPVVEHAIAEYSAAGRRPDAVMLLQATSPVRLPGTLDRAIAQFIESGVDSMVGAVAQTPFLWQHGADEGDQPKAHFTVDARPRRQELERTQMFYRETGSLYLTRTETYERDHNRLGGTIGIFEMDDVEGVDIDTELDLSIADHQLSQLHRDEGSASSPETAAPTDKDSAQ
ncbi:cytidylyltransferase domain-containing protein [Pseudoclavibacter sp. RFBA6]|uniref:acylneuraminate cytidylyltransferase family protein n=1 Tax=Pseudoclavibacter sp. RFBA6 TaxID=2080573 RepID=UPI000CE7A5EA|nr:acylneuraminate cytidylyltransferase family protein [Pseudoclavibacter sp. RFBA6]PPG42712.1 acylneuraminate cytidylyltransferase [Pseudoclavibacter sp. RFBA6]